MYVGSPYCRAEMCAGRVTCCPLVSHVDRALHAVLTLEKKMRQTDARPMHYTYR